jgi:hypothetical protein
MTKVTTPTIKVAGHWELDWNTPIKEVELWNLLLRDFAIEDWYMWPVSGIKHTEETWVHLHERPTFNDILTDTGVKGLKQVYFEPYNPVQQPEQGIDLRDLKHPQNVLYIFGSAHYNPVPGHKTNKDILVQVPTVENKGVLWPHQCLAMCLYDRLVKSRVPLPTPAFE